MRRFLTVSLLSLVFLLSLPSAFALAEPVTIQYMYLAEAEATEQRVAAMIDAFEAANPDIKIDRIRVVSNHRNHLVTLLAAGMMPDVVALDMNFAVEFGDERVLLDLMPYIAADPSMDLADYAPVTVETFRDGDKLFALPRSSEPTAYMYNVDLLEQLGLVEPAVLYARDEWTWSAFREIAMKATQKTPDGVYERLGSTLHLPRVWIWSNGGQEVDDPKWPTETRYHEREAVEALTFLQQLVWDDDAMATPGFMRMTDLIRPRLGVDETAGFLGGRIGMISRWITFLPRMTESIFDVGIVPIPKGPSEKGRYATDLGIWGNAISAQTEHPEAAWRFVAFMSGLGGAEICAQSPGCVPARPMRIEWVEDLVVNPHIVPELLPAGGIRVISKERELLLGMVNDEVAKVMAGEAPAESAGVAIRNRVAALLAQQ